MKKSIKKTLVALLCVSLSVVVFTACNKGVGCPGEMFVTFPNFI